MTPCCDIISLGSLRCLLDAYVVENSSIASRTVHITNFFGMVLNNKLNP